MQEWEFSFGVPFTFLWKPVNSKILAYPKAASQFLLIPARFSLLSSTPVTTMSIRVTRKSYKVSTSSLWAFSSYLYMNTPGTGISSSAFSQMGNSSSSWGWPGHQHEYGQGLLWGPGTWRASQLSQWTRSCWTPLSWRWTPTSRLCVSRRRSRSRCSTNLLPSSKRCSTWSSRAKF